MAYVFQEYPKTLYISFDGITVNNAEEEVALGAGYSPFPADPNEPAEELAEDKPRRGRPRKEA